MSYAQAVTCADKLAKGGAMRFVVFESGEYHIANETELDTWFAGIADRNILYCTADYQN